ncbi:uncharacterized protein E0L32_003605 [Thyridium curvatum]|uniref:Diphthamide biosynthesis protein 4 n=1 Tax=Thyridium curvatum TaxID=1093900 RepID=A0A507BDA6_9PEZI|nr:uncharacterized protein E0L32_003605 [Thyridium curvatum]TPX16664.1 hypothetical protein E0L32_003605 [Thyridium curvatum]
MAVPATAAPEPGQPTHYEILDLPQPFLASQRDPAPLVRRAYRRALLRHHPDKAAILTTTASTTSTTTSTTSTTSSLTIDQISAAFAVLSDPAARASYDRALKLARPPHQPPGWQRQQGGDGPGPGPGGSSSSFQTGVESVDLDDLGFDEEDSVWYRGCRCGNDRGFALGEPDLESAAEDGELLVGCLDCSLWLRVHFAVVEETAAGGSQKESFPAVVLSGLKAAHMKGAAEWLSSYEDWTSTAVARTTRRTADANITAVPFCFMQPVRQRSPACTYQREQVTAWDALSTTACRTVPSSMVTLRNTFMT